MADSRVPRSELPFFAADRIIDSSCITICTKRIKYTEGISRAKQAARHATPKTAYVDFQITAEAVLYLGSIVQPREPSGGLQGAEVRGRTDSYRSAGTGFQDHH
jgi:hypothetical protein